jgi:hypothetical protein
MKFALGLEKSEAYDKLDIKLTLEEKNILVVMLWLIYTGQSFVDCTAVSVSNLIPYSDKSAEEHLFIKYTRTKNKIKKEVKIPLTRPIIELLLFYYSQYDQSNAIIKKLMGKKKVVPKASVINSKSKFDAKYFQLVWTMKSLLITFDHTENSIPHYPYLIPQYSLQYYNRALKLVAEKIGLTQSVSTAVTWGGRLGEQRKDRLCDLISTHLGRKAYITFQRQNDVPYEVIMETTGISSMNTLLSYNKVSMEQLTPTSLQSPVFKSNVELEKNLLFNIQLNSYNTKNSEASRFSQINRSSKKK